MTTTAQRFEVSRDGENWLPVFLWPVRDTADARPESVLPEGWAWERVGGAWKPVQVAECGLS